MNIEVIKDCKYRLPCGWCDRRNEFCLLYGSFEPNDSSFEQNDNDCKHTWIYAGQDENGEKCVCSKCYTTKTVPRKNTQT